MTVQRTAVGLACALTMLACDGTQSGLKPVGGEQISPTEVERFVRRAHLDMTGQTAPAQFVDDKREALIAAGNSPEARGEVVSELVATPEWATAFVEELDNRAFTTNDFEFAYSLLCNGQRENNPQCSSCQPSADQCQGCSCAAVVDLLEERTSIENAAADLAAGDATTGDIERRFAATQGYRFGRGIEGLATNLFEDFLDRAAEGDEIANAAALIIGFVAAPDNAAGLLFHRHGADYDDLIDIIFTSEIYRGAVISRAFDRLLGRPASPAEIAHFTKALDVDAVDVRDVLTAIVSSREYFNQ